MKSRVVTGLVLVAAALVLVFAASPLVGWAASLVLGGLGGFELVRLVSPRRDSGASLAIACLVAVVAGTASALGASLSFLVVLGGVALLLLSPKPGLAATIGGIAWLGGGLSGLGLLASTHPASTHSASGLWDGRPIVLLLLLPIWAADTFAYFGGRAFGRRLLAPKISPKKTIEGAACGLLAALVVGALAAPWLGRSVETGLLVGGLAATLGPAGDLLESALKRRANVKDSGTLLPGHGGVLDRIDSLLIAAPVAAILLTR